MVTYTNWLKYANPAIGSTEWGDDWYKNQIMNDLINKQGLRRNYTLQGGGVTQNQSLSVDIEAAVSKVKDAMVETAEWINASVSPSTDPAAVEPNYIYVDTDGLMHVSSSPPPPTDPDFNLVAIVDTNQTGIEHIADLRAKPVASREVSAAGLSIVGGVSGYELVAGTNVITVSAGLCMDSTGLIPMPLNVDNYKEVDQPWAAYPAYGGNLGPALKASTVYNIYVISGNSGAVDVGILEKGLDILDYLPFGYSVYRWLGFTLTDESSLLLGMVLSGDTIVYSDKNMAINVQLAASVGTSWTVFDLSGVLPEKGATRVKLGANEYLTSGATNNVRYSMIGLNADAVVDLLDFLVTPDWSREAESGYLRLKPDNTAYYSLDSSGAYTIIPVIKEVTIKR